MVSVMVLAYSRMPPALWLDVLPEMVQPVSLTVPLAARPPPAKVAELPEITVSVAIKGPLPWALMPPPLPLDVALLPDTTHWVRVSDPLV